MIDRFGVEGLDNRDVINDAGYLWKNLGYTGSVFAVAFEFKHGRNSGE